MQAPVVVQHLLLQRVRVFDLALLEQADAFKGMLAQHAVTPAVYRKDGGLIHRTGCRVETQRIPQQVRFAAIPQLQQKVIGLGLCQRVTMKHPRGLGQPFTDALAQLFHGGIGKGHHQDLTRL